MSAEPDLPLTFDGPGSFDQAGYNGAIIQARALLDATVNAYWDTLVRSDRRWYLIQQAAVALFRETSPLSDPYALVVGREPPRLGLGWAFQGELVPAWALYVGRASDLLTLLEKVVKREANKSVFDRPEFQEKRP